MPVFMAATPDFVDKSPDTVVAYLKCWQEVARDFKDNPGKVADVIYAFFTSKGYTMSRDTFAKALGTGRRSIPASPPISRPACRGTPRCCCARRRFPPSRTGRRRCGRTSGPRPARRGVAVVVRRDRAAFPRMAAFSTLTPML